MEFLTGLLGSAKQLTPALLIGAAITCGVALYSPPSFLEQLGLTEFVAEQKKYIGAALLVSLALLAAQILVGSWALVKMFYAKKRAKDEAVKLKDLRLQVLSKLTPEEKAYLAPYIFNTENTQYFAIDDGVVGGLTAKRILYRASSVSARWTMFAFNMQPWAREHLEQNPDLLQ